ncbi:MAG: ATP-binding protein [Chitinispirillia bacterium]|nr:ATP-binding protein [Chitinispirillia bacterium]
MTTEKIQTPLPRGESFFDSLIENGCYYVDKSLFIKELLDKPTKVTLCTRPRRFGKTINQTMLKCFFEDTAEVGGKDMRPLFRGLKIEAAGDHYMAHQGKYPVIFLSFKEAERDTFEASYKKLKTGISREFKRHAYAVEKLQNKDDRELFKNLSNGKASEDDYSGSLQFLSECLANYHGTKAIILIDEYDVPLQKSWFSDYYEEMINFIRPLLSSALKDNTSLQFAVITGCLRVSKESIFTGLNNPTMISVLNREYSEYFGFTQSEIDAMLKHYGLEEKRQLLRDWYNGYLFGNTEVYNPFSSVLVVGSWLVYAEEFPKPYWVNTSGNDIVRKLIDVADNETRSELEVLMAGGTITKPVCEDITYEDIYKNSDNLWNFMFFTGYLKKVAESVDEKGRIVVEMKIPNKELDIIFYNKVQEWFREQVKQRDLSKLYEAILSGNAPVLQEELGDFMLDTISYMDGKEDFYHGVMLGILSGMQKYSVKSNRETGLGRCDIIMTHRSGRGKAIIFELKWTIEMGEIQKKRDEAEAARTKLIIDYLHTENGMICDTPRNNLARLEHLRWNTFYLVSGWAKMPLSKIGIGNPGILSDANKCT